MRPRIKEDGDVDTDTVVTPDLDDDSVVKVTNSQGRGQHFDLDRVFGQDSTQAQVITTINFCINTQCVIQPFSSTRANGFMKLATLRSIYLLASW